MRSGAWPTTRIPRTCRLRARREPPINQPINPTRPESGLGPLENHSTYHPRAWPIARTEGERRRPRQRPPAPGPPIFAIPLERGGPGGRGLVTGDFPVPSLSCLFSRCVSKTQDSLSYISERSPRRPEGAADSPACGSCRRPLRSNEKQGIEEHCAKAQSASFSSLFSSGRANQ